ncbi:Flp pilus assembly complex ATPase component TadA [Candidatus Uhrbacteria bacterium]|nr:Flp pilus assembly complex ATPase component TadA [Candidatus Uhrbacteria bacterium]
MDTAETLSFRKMLVTAAKRDATDLHLTVGSPPMIRVDGILEPLEGEDILTSLKIERIVESMTSPDQRDRLAKERDIVVMTVFDNKIRGKVHIFFQESSMTVSLRFLTLNVETIRALNMPPAIEAIAVLKNGLVIVGGHFGSGRTTLALALLEHINRARVEHILTIEDPIEYDMVGNKSIVNQREVGRDVNSFDAALDAIEKEDVDVVFISELENTSATRKVLELANAGILVIAVMDVSSSDKALEKIISGFPSSEQTYITELLADALRAIVIQYLLPRIGGGLVPVHEVLVNTSSVRSFILSQKFSQLAQIIASSRAQGMISFDHELASMVKNRIVSLEHAREVVKNTDIFESLVKGIFS